DTYLSSQNSQWGLANLNPINIMYGVATAKIDGIPLPLFFSASGPPNQLATQLPQGTGYSGAVTAAGGHETIGQLLAHSVALAEQPNAASGSITTAQIA